jgi:hypothetical protein
MLETAGITSLSVAIGQVLSETCFYGNAVWKGQFYLSFYDILWGLSHQIRNAWP